MGCAANLSVWNPALVAILLLIQLQQLQSQVRACAAPAFCCVPRAPAEAAQQQWWDRISVAWHTSPVAAPGSACCMPALPADLPLLCACVPAASVAATQVGPVLRLLAWRPGAVCVRQQQRKLCYS